MSNKIRLFSSERVEFNDFDVFYFELLLICLSCAGKIGTFYERASNISLIQELFEALRSLPLQLLSNPVSYTLTASLDADKRRDYYLPLHAPLDLDIRDCWNLSQPPPLKKSHLQFREIVSLVYAKIFDIMSATAEFRLCGVYLDTLCEFISCVDILPAVSRLLSNRNDSLLTSSDAHSLVCSLVPLLANSSSLVRTECLLILTKYSELFGFDSDMINLLQLYNEFAGLKLDALHGRERKVLIDAKISPYIRKFTSLSSVCQESLISFLVGIFHLHYVPIWSVAAAQLANVSQLSPKIFWTIFSKFLQQRDSAELYSVTDGATSSDKLVTDDTEVEVSQKEWGVWGYFDLSTHFYRVTSRQRVDIQQNSVSVASFLISTWKVLSHSECGSCVELFTQDIVKMIQIFLYDYFRDLLRRTYLSKGDVFDEFRTADDKNQCKFRNFPSETDRSQFSLRPQNCLKWTEAKEILIQSFSLFSRLSLLPLYHKIFTEVLLNALTSPVQDIQSNSLAALLLMYPSPEISRWKDTLKGLVNDKSFLSTLSELDVRDIIGEGGTDATSYLSFLFAVILEY